MKTFTEFLTEAAPNKNQELALEIKKAADKHGWKISISVNALVLTKPISNRSDYDTANSEVHPIITLLPYQSSGTTSGSMNVSRSEVGIENEIKGGIFKVTRTGGSKRVIAALKKLI